MPLPGALVIVGLRTDWRPGEDHGTNCMLHRSCHFVLPNITEICRWLRQHHHTHPHGHHHEPLSPRGYQPISYCTGRGAGP